MKELLLKIQNGATLTQEEACATLLDINNGTADPIQTGALLAMISQRTPTVDELLGFRQGLLETCVSADLSDFNPVDIVGTGGDGKNTFNISTCSCFVVAGAGLHVAKHGNFGATSVSGASNVIKEHGVVFSASRDRLMRSIEQSGVAYLHAPLFHPAMKNAAPVRKALGIPTIFNLLGPLINPAHPRHQLLGTANLAQMRLYYNTLKRIGTRFAIVTSMDGYDEISLTADFKVMTPHYETIYSPADLGLGKAPQQSLSGGSTAAEASAIFDAVLENRATAYQKNAVIANSAFAIQAATGRQLDECLAMARESLESGRALQSFKKFVEANSQAE